MKPSSENTTMMQTVVFTEAFFFLCLIMSYIYLAYSSGFEPHDLSKLNIGTSGIYTALLIISSFTLHLAERGYDRGNTRTLKTWLIITLILGAIFLIGQGREYTRLIQEKITLESSIFGASFFTLTGFHGLHVFIGLVILSIMLVLAFLGDFNHEQNRENERDHDQTYPTPPNLQTNATSSYPAPGNAQATATATSTEPTGPYTKPSSGGTTSSSGATPSTSTTPSSGATPTSGTTATPGPPGQAAAPTKRPTGGGALGAVAIYWHFVDIVWIVVFTVVYVLPQFTNI